jgi:hypothetical protein
MAHLGTLDAATTRQAGQRATFNHHTIPVINQRSVESIGQPSIDRIAQAGRDAGRQGVQLAEEARRDA